MAIVVLHKLESDVTAAEGMTPKLACLYSQAISLKRIADMLEPVVTMETEKLANVISYVARRVENMR